MTHIYVLACIHLSPCGRRDQRVWGCYATLEEAQAHLASGDDLLFESDTYEWGLIEKVPLGVVPALLEMETWWYHKVRGEDRAEPCPPPEWAEGTIGWTMG